VKAFAKMRSAKKEEIKGTRSELRAKMDSLESGLNDLVRAKKSIKNTSEQLAIDRKFLADAEANSKADKEELAARSAAQGDELAAIKETVGILTADESRMHFEKTKPASFLQLSSGTSVDLSSRRARAAAVLRASNKPELALLATNVQLAAFEDVKKMIADLINDLKAKKADEVEKRNFCVSEFSSNEKDSDETANSIEDLTAKADSLEANSKSLSDAIAKTKKSQEKLQMSVAGATSLRVESSAEYQQIYQDFLVTKNILDKAIVRLQAFYAEKKTSFLQQEPAPTGLSKDGFKKKAGMGVVGMIRMIIEDSKKSALEAQSDEKAAQKAYEEAMADARSESSTLKATLTSQKEAKADTNAELSSTKADQQGALRKLEDLQVETKALHGDCDFLMSNFDNRQSGLAQEAEALQQAIEILSGAQ